MNAIDITIGKKIYSITESDHEMTPKDVEAVRREILKRPETRYAVKDGRITSQTKTIGEWEGIVAS